MADNLIRKNELLLINRTELSLDGVHSISSFDEDYLELDTELGKMSVEGAELKIEEFIQNSGKIKIKGKINAIFYQKENLKKKKSR